MLIGKHAIQKLSRSRVLLLGLGGVGSYCLEALVRAGIGEIHVVDGDVIEGSNVNRQLLAVSGNYDKPKVVAAAERAASINPDCIITPYHINLSADNLTDLPLSSFDYIADAIDTVTVKISLAEYCFQNGVRLISAMGAGNRLDPTAFRVGDIFETDLCPLCRVMRQELRLRGVQSLRVVYSLEKPVAKIVRGVKKQTPSISFTPPVSGLIMAGEIIKSLIANLIIKK